MIDEEEFNERFHKFDYFLKNPDIEGIYETKVPLKFKFISEIGCFVKLKKDRIKGIQSYSNHIFNFEDMNAIFSGDYLPEFNIPVISISQISIS